MHMIVGGCEDEGCLRLMHVLSTFLFGTMTFDFSG